MLNLFDKFYIKGKLLWSNGSKYEGEWKDAHPHGKGIHFVCDKKKVHFRLFSFSFFQVNSTGVAGQYMKVSLRMD